MGSGRLHCCDLARLIVMAAANFSWWANLWAISYRKFFWDLVNGTLGPTGFIAPPSSAFFVAIIVKAPVLQIVNILIAVFALLLEYPAPFFKGTIMERAIVFRVVFYFFAGFTNLLIYQGVDCGVFFLIGSALYGMAIRKGERIAGDGNDGQSGEA